MIEVYSVNTSLYITMVLAVVLFSIGIFLLINTTGKRYIGLALIGICTAVIFYSFTSVLIPSMPSMKYIRLIGCILVFLGGTYFLVLEFIIFKNSFINEFPQADYIIVHGAKVLGSTPSPSLQDRLDGTLLYLSKFPQCKAVLTGTKWPWGEVSEAQCMYDWLIARGIDENRLILEEKAKNTVDNLRYSMESITALEPAVSPIIGILTSEYHMHRALYLADVAGIAAVGIPVKTKRLSIRVNYFIREAFAMTEVLILGVKHK